MTDVDEEDIPESPELQQLEQRIPALHRHRTGQREHCGTCTEYKKHETQAGMGRCRLLNMVVAEDAVQCPDYQPTSED